MKKIILIFILFLISSLSFALGNLKFDGFISDNANVLSQNSKKQINALLFDLQNKTKADVALVTLNTLNGAGLEQTALNIGRSYKIGDRKLNNGAVILVVVKDRVMRIEIGYGLEHIITDAHAGRIRDLMTPYFKEYRYQDGIMLGIYTLASDIAKGYGQTLSENPPEIEPLQDNPTGLDYVIFILVLIFVL